MGKYSPFPPTPTPPPYIMSPELRAEQERRMKILLQRPGVREFIRDMLVAASSSGKYGFADIIEMAGLVYPPE